jgi:hypothetical protein
MIKVASYVESHVSLLALEALRKMNSRWDKSISTNTDDMPSGLPTLAGKIDVNCQEYIDILSKSSLQFTYTPFLQEGMMMVYYKGGYDQIYGAEEDLKKIIKSVKWHSEPLSTRIKINDIRP